MTGVQTCALPIYESILSFLDSNHKKIFYEALTSAELSATEKLLLIFWQMIYANELFQDITAEVFMRAVYQGRTSLTQDDVHSYMRYLKDKNPNDLNWTESTLKITSSKYLTVMKKLGLAEGSNRKKICYPVMSDTLFVYFIRWSLTVCPTNQSVNNPFMGFGFYDKMTLISKLKRIDFIKYWDITQLGDEVTIELKPYE